MSEIQFSNEIKALRKVLARLDDFAIENLRLQLEGGGDTARETEKRLQRARRAVSKAILELNSGFGDEWGTSP